MTVTIYATFGTKYAHEDHPTMGFAHPDGWLTVTSPTHEEARALLARVTTPWNEVVPHYAFSYDSLSEMTPRLYPRGQLAHVEGTADHYTLTIGGAK